MATEEVAFGVKDGVQALRYDRVIHADQPAPGESDSIILDLIAPSHRVLDVGCGTGALTSLLARKSRAQVIGVEPNAVRAQAARDKGLDVRTGLLTADLLQKLGTFDTIVFADVLEHLEDPASLLRAVRPALHPDGRVIASIPNVAHWTVRKALVQGRFNYQPTGIMDATHLRWFTRRTVMALFAEAGFTVQRIEPSVGYWLPQYGMPPFTWLPKTLRRSLVSAATQRWPGLFGCQHVVCATIGGTAS